MCDFNALDARVLGAMDGRERIKLLLKDAGGIQGFAKRHGLWTEQVSMCLRGDRVYPEIREQLAADLEICREMVDKLIDGEKAA